MKRIKKHLNSMDTWSKSLSKEVKAAIIGGLFVVIGAIIAGLFTLGPNKVIVIPATSIVTTSSPKAESAACPGPADFTFQDRTLGNWVIRHEGTKEMGISLKYSNAMQCNGNPVDSMAFKFQLGEGHGAQIGLDGRGIPLVGSISAWFYAPENTPSTVAVRCILMEGESRGWAWHETDEKPLSPGEWVKIDCPYSQFHWVEGGDGTEWQNPLQFIGLGFLDIQGGSYQGTVYVTGIDIK